MVQRYRVECERRHFQRELIYECANRNGSRGRSRRSRRRALPRAAFSPRRAICAPPTPPICWRAPSKVAAIAAEHAAAVDRDSRFPDEAIAAARAERLLGIAVPRELGGEGAEHRRDCRHLLRARPRLRVDRDDLCDAPDQGRLPGPSRPQQRLVSAFAAPARQRATAVRVLDHRRAERRRRAQQRRAHYPQRLAHRPGTASHRHLLRQGGRRHRHHRAPRRRQRRFRSGSGHLPQAGLHARAPGRLGRVRHARHLQRRFQARRRPVRASRSCRWATTRSTPRP